MIKFNICNSAEVKGYILNNQVVMSYEIKTRDIDQCQVDLDQFRVGCKPNI